MESEVGQAGSFYSPFKTPGNCVWATVNNSPFFPFQFIYYKIRKFDCAVRAVSFWLFYVPLTVRTHYHAFCNGHFVSGNIRSIQGAYFTTAQGAKGC